MPPKSRFTRLDAFTKTVEDARVRTTSGGVITIVSVVLMLFLVWGEWADYRKISVHPELVVDKGRGERMEIHLNMSFPRMPCELLTLDVMDVSGEVQMGVMTGVKKVRLTPASEGSKAIEARDLELQKQEDAPVHLDPNYCGECYGVPAPSTAKKPGCCNTCAEVRDAYAEHSWAFGRGENVEQCQREHYAEHLDAQRSEGCRIEGVLRVNKVVGNFHFAPGKSFTHGPQHLHDLDNFYNSGVQHTFTHSIHYLRFGPQIDDHVAKRFGAVSNKQITSHHLNPLDETFMATDERPHNYMYFLKIVSTAYLPLGWEKKSLNPTPEDQIEIGKYGYVEGGSIETHQYSVTSHERSLIGGTDEAEGHKERIHAKGGIPGVWFSYDISPMKVINKEQRTKSFSAFLVGVCAVIGGTLTVAAAVDRGFYAGERQMNKLKDR